MFASLVRHKRFPLIACAVLVALLLAKFFLPAFLYGVPLGYDAGMYRYLFLRYAENWPPYALPALEPWAKAHPIGLFLLASPFLRVGLPVDWLTGWVWNLFPVALACVLAWVTSRKHDKLTGALVLVAALASVAYFDGFAAMYWKTYVSLFFVVLAFHFLERFSPWALPFAFLALITHHQTGLLFGLAVACWWATLIHTHWRKRSWQVGTAAVALIALASLLFYLPVWQEAVRAPLLSIFLLRGDTAPGGSFPPLSYFLRVSCLLFALGVAGFALSFRKERGTLWQWSVAWAAIFVFFKLVFYRRFFLQLDFFLLPFAALAMRQLWLWLRGKSMQVFLPIVVILQIGLSFWLAAKREPAVPAQTFTAARAIESQVPSDALVVALENQSAWLVRGYLPHHRVENPGVFDSAWNYDQWKAFLLGTFAERKAFLATLKSPVYLFVTPFFREYYKQSADAFLSDPCFAQTDTPWLIRSICSQDIGS